MPLGRLHDLRQRRLALRAEQIRSRYLSRLLRARLDLTVAATVRAHEQERTTDLTADLPPGLPVPPTADEVEGLLRHPGGDLADHLASLQDALARMCGYEEALDRECEESTEQLVHALTRSPRACLEPAPALPRQRHQATDQAAG